MNRLRLTLGACVVVLAAGTPARADQLSLSYDMTAKDGDDEGAFDGDYSNVTSEVGSSSFLNWSNGASDGTYDRVYFGSFNTAGWKNVTAATLQWDYSAASNNDTDPTDFAVNWFVGTGTAAGDLAALNASLSAGRSNPTTQSTHPFGFFVQTNIPDGGSGTKSINVLSAVTASISGGELPAYFGFFFYNTAGSTNQNYDLLEGTAKLNLTGEHGTPAAVPEPATLSLLGISGLAALGRARRRKS